MSFLRELSGLQTLYLSRNPITNYSFLKELSGLQTLDLSNNQLTDVSFLRELSGLQTLYLSNNQIAEASSVAVILFKNPRLYSIWLDKGIAGIPEGLEMDAKGLRAYFEKQGQEAQPQPNRSLKLILLGNTRAGKSQLLNYLSKGQYTKESQSTHGIKIKSWQAQIQGNKYRLTCFDFGGQDFYHATHNLYLDSRALYLTLWQPLPKEKGGEGDQHFPLGYWLGNVDYFTGEDTNREVTANDPSRNMAVWAIQSRADECERQGIDKEWTDLYKVEPEGQFYLSVQGAYGKDARWQAEWSYFKQHLDRKIEALTQKAELFTHEMIQVRDEVLPALRHEQHLVMERTAFVKYCDQRLGKPTGKSDYYDTLLVMKAAGELLWYKELPAAEAYLIVDPAGWSNFVFKVLANEAMAKNNGEFSRADVNKTIRRSKVREEEKTLLPRLFVALLKHYQIIFERPDAPGQFVVPQYLPEQKLARHLQKLIPLTFVVRYEHYMPFWRISNFIARKGAQVQVREPHYWRYGMIYEENGCSVMVRVQRSFAESQGREQRLFVHIEGQAAQRSKLLEEIFDFFTRVHRFGETKSSAAGNTRLIPPSASSQPVEEAHTQQATRRHEKLPFIKKIQFSTNDRDFFGAEELQESLSGSEKFMKTTTGKVLPIPALFYSLLGRQNLMPKRIFFSYSHVDATYRRELETHFAALKRGQYVETWHDLEIAPGEDWDERIMAEMEKADLVLALISPDFMNSSYIWEREIPKMTDKFVPIFLRPCDIDETIIAQVDGLPKDFETKNKEALKGIQWIVSSHWQYRDQAYLSVVEGLKKKMKAIG